MILMMILLVIAVFKNYNFCGYVMTVSKATASVVPVTTVVEIK